MSITAAELIAYASANLPTDDVSTTGGAIDATRRPVFTQFSSSAKVSLTSDGTDTRNVTITGRDATGAVVSEVVALTSAVEVLSVNTYERLQSVNIASSSGTRTVTVKQGAGGTTITTIPVNEVGFYMLFQNAASSTTGSKLRYEKFFIKNTDSTLTLTSSVMQGTADPAAVTSWGCAPSVSDSATVANRLSAPASVTFVAVSVAQNVPGGNIAAAAAIGIWVLQTLATNNAAVRNTFTTQLTGNTV